MVRLVRLVSQCCFVVCKNMSSWAKNSPRFLNSGKKCLILSAVCTVISLGGALSSTESLAASVFEIPPYKSTVHNCTSGGCCTQPMDSLVQQMFRGTLLYTGQQDLQQYYYLSDLKPAMRNAYKSMADELRNATMLPIAVMGSFFDGQTFEQTLLSLQKQSAETLETQTVSDQICRFGTLSRSLAQSDDKAKLVQLSLAAAMMNRQTLHENMNSAFEEGTGRTMGRGADKAGRIALVKTLFCDPKDAGGGTKSWCESTSEADRNRDIDTLRSFYAPQTLDIDFSQNATEATRDEKSLFALASNLFAHDLPANITVSDLEALNGSDAKNAKEKLNRLMEFRSLVAKRSVAQNSFAALAAMKAAGAGSSALYMKEIVRNLGLDDAAQAAEIGDHPSYNAQMNMLTRTLYQSPSFYANLMESTTNVARQQSAMESIALMQDRDIYDSLRRSEMLLSTLLETYIAQSQDALQDRGTKE